MKKRELNNLLYCSKKRGEQISSRNLHRTRNACRFFLGTGISDPFKKELFMKSKVCLQLCVFCKLNRIFQPEELLFIKKLESSFMDWAGSRWILYFFVSVELRTFITTLPGRTTLKAHEQRTSSHAQAEQSDSPSWRITCFLFSSLNKRKEWRTCYRINHFTVKKRKRLWGKSIKHHVQYQEVIVEWALRSKRHMPLLWWIDGSL